MNDARPAFSAWWEGFRRQLTNSPTWERDAATLTSPLRIGGWFLVLNLLIVTGMVLAFAFLALSQLPISHSSGSRPGTFRFFAGLAGRATPRKFWPPRASDIS